MAETKKTNIPGGNDWKKILEMTRDNYLQALKKLGELQKETETLITDFANKGKSIQEENLKMIEEWVNNVVKSGEQFKKVIEDSQKKVMSIFKDLKIADMEFPFKKEFENMLKNIEENTKKYFSLLKS